MPKSISLLVDSPLRDLLLALRNVPADVKRQVNAASRKAAQPIWFEETRDRGATRLQQLVLVKTARVGVSARNIQLKSGVAGRLRSGTPASVLAHAVEWGMDPTSRIATTSRKGKSYTRRAGSAFGARVRRGRVVYPAAAASMLRITSLIIQTTARSLLDALDLKG